MYVLIFLYDIHMDLGCGIILSPGYSQKGARHCETLGWGCQERRFGIDLGWWVFCLFVSVFCSITHILEWHQEGVLV